MVWRGSTELTDNNVEGVRKGRREELRRKERRGGGKSRYLFLFFLRRGSPVVN
jgi:hypothetical protein